jgi:anaerobic dimethyl sulfoxide reductase subunit A
MNPTGNSDPEDRIITSACSFDCGARCLLQVQVAGRVVQKITTDDQPGPGLKACARGLAQREVLYAKDRPESSFEKDRGEGERKI